MSYLSERQDFDGSPEVIHWTCPPLFWILTSV